MKILVIYATAGAGHRKAAEALAGGLKTRTSHQIVLLDALDHTSVFYKKLYSGVYTFLITHAGWLWGTLFGLLDWRPIRPFVNCARRIQNGINAGSLHRYLKQENFDYIFSTHFFPTEVAAYLKREGAITSRIVSVITDFDVHSIWLAKGIDHYTVASEWTKRKLTAMGVPDRAILVSGIPTDEKFSRPADAKELRRRFGLKEDLLTVLIATGSFGIGPIEAIIRVLRDFQAVVICGHNRSLQERLSAYGGERVKVFGLVNNMDEMMALADVMITKPGGLSISEALVRGLPMIFFNAIPGQETGNIKVLKEYGVGISDCAIADIPKELHRLQSPGELQSAKERIRTLSKPSAVRDVISLVSRIS